MRIVLQSLEIAAQKTHSLKKKGLREGILSILDAAARNLLRSLQDNGSIGQFELDSACISWLAKLPAHQQTQVRLPISVYVLLSMTGNSIFIPTMYVADMVSKLALLRSKHCISGASVSSATPPLYQVMVGMCSQHPPKVTSCKFLRRAVSVLQAICINVCCQRQAHQAK